MTAAELYSVVKDVPREAWPEHVTFADGLWFVTDDPMGRMSICNAHAELLFVGSMTKWLGDRGPLVSRRRGYPETWKVQMCINDDVSEFEATTLIEALAAACKAVGGAKGGDAH